MKQPAIFHIKPRAGRRVRDPITLRVLDDAGDMKPQSNYWLRRLQDGDVEVVSAAKVSAPKNHAAKAPTSKE